MSDYRERRYTSQDGLSLYFRDYGDPLSPAVPALCLGGLTRNSSDFSALARRLAENRRVICPDYRGRGKSDYDPNWQNYQPPTYVQDMIQLMAALNIHKVVVVGTSLGGLLGMGLGVAAPGALAGVVLNDIGPEIEMDGLEHIIEYISEDRALPDWDAAVQTIKDLMPGVQFQDDDTWLKMAQNTYVEKDDGKLHFNWDVNIAKPIKSGQEGLPDLWPLFRALAHVPVLAFRGEVTDLLTRDCFEKMATALPDITCVTVPRTGHAPTLSEPECVAAMDAYLGRIAH